MSNDQDRMSKMKRFLVAIIFGILVTPNVYAAEEAAVMDVAKELACLCGTCPTRPLDECRCGYAGQQRERIANALDSGQSKEQVIAGFVSQFGEEIFVTPPKKGFNLMAWFMPFFGIAVGGVAVRSVLKGWSKKESQTQAKSSSTLSDEDRKKLDAALGSDA